jgi:hypothetical protein
MKFSPALKLLVSALALTVATAAIWYVGFLLGKGAISGANDAAVFRAAYPIDEPHLASLFFLALLVTLTLQISPASTGKWAVVGVIAFAAAMLPNTGGMTALGMGLLVIATVAVAETNGTVPQLVAAAIAGTLVAAPVAMDARFSTGATVGVSLLRGVFYFAPLLLLTPYVQRLVIKKLP